MSKRKLKEIKEIKGHNKGEIKENFKKRRKIINFEKKKKVKEEKEEKSDSLIYTNSEMENIGINPQHLNIWKSEFNENPLNIIAKNSVMTVGSTFASTNLDKANISHIFLHSLKKDKVKATDQGNSGRCWIFAGLNMFRHVIMKVLNLENFEFSETYLQFWDKMERANYYLDWFINNSYKSDFNFDSRDVHHILGTMSDGGHWNYFINLVNKYGLVPKSAMEETYQSDDSSDMNNILFEHLDGCAHLIYQNYAQKKIKCDDPEIITLKNQTLQNIYNILVKFLGKPPNDYTWYFTTDGMYKIEEGHNSIKANPTFFPELIKHTLGNFSEFVVLTNFPVEKYDDLYQIKLTSNMVNTQNATFLNLKSTDLKRYTKKSLMEGIPVWFGADVGKYFNPYHSTLNSKIFDTKLIFGKHHEMDKKSRIEMRNTNANHAMVFTGMNVSNKDQVISWQVENSWGYYDNHIPGLDGFLHMDDEWFDEHVFEVVIRKDLLSRYHQKLLDKIPIMLEAWSNMGSCLKINPK